MAPDASFLETIAHTLSGNNDLRNAAERRYAEGQKVQPAATVVGLFQIIQEATVDQVLREQAAVLLRRCFDNAKQADSLWIRLGAAGQADVKQRLLQLLEIEPLPKLRRKVADCAQSLGNELIDVPGNQRPQNAPEWPELMPTLMRIVCDPSREAGIRADSLWVVKELTVSVWQILVAGSGQSCQVIRNCLADSNDAVRSEAACLLCTVVDNIEAREERQPFAPAIPDFTGVVTALAGQSDWKPLQSVLQSMNNTTETADFFKDHISSHFQPVMIRIASAHPDEGCRKLALQVLLTFLESKPKTLLKAPGYVEQLLEVCVKFLVMLKDDVAAWAEVDEEEEGEDDEDFYDFGNEAIDRICRCASQAEVFSHVLEKLKPAITQLFTSPDWKQVVAGISMLSQVLEFVDDEATVLQMLGAVRTQLAASHPRVRYVTWGCIAQFAVDHADTITTDALAAQLLPEFLKSMDDSCGRVALRCMQAFHHYGEHVEREDLEPFTQGFMQKLGAKLQADKRFQKQAITTIAVIAGQVDDAFAPYYGQLMPLLLKIIQSTLHKVEERTLLGKCFECISLMATCVGRDVFKPEAQVIMQAMIQATQVPNLPSNDPVKEYMMAASERICQTLKEDFLPFVPHILPGVLEKLKVTPKEVTGASISSLTDNPEMHLTFTRENGKLKALVISSSEVEVLQGALECVNKFVQQLGKAYSPFVMQTAQALLPVFEFSAGEEIRDLAFDTWGELCSCAKQGGQTQVVGELVLGFLGRVLPKLEGEDGNAFELKTQVDGITGCLKKAGPGILSPQQVKHLCRVTLARMGQSLMRRAELSAKRKARKAADQADADDGALEAETLEAHEAFRGALCEVAGALMQHHPDSFVSEGFAEYLGLAQQLAKTGEIEDLKVALCVVCDFLEHLGSRVTPQWQNFMPLLLDNIMHSDAEVRQPACYGLSVAARDPAFAPLAADVAAKLSRVVTESRGRAKKKSEKIAQASADNALSAIIEILQHHASAVSASLAQLWGVWLGGLPCQMDEQEGQKNHGILLRLLQQERPEVVGEGGQNVPRLLSILVDLYKTDMVDEATTKGIAQLAMRLGEAKLQQLAAGYTEKQKKRLMRAVQDARKESLGGA